MSKKAVSLGKAIEKLNSGLRINRSADDAAGLAISEKLRTQLRGINRSILNSEDAISMVQTFEGALEQSHSVLKRCKELAAEAANGTYDNETDRAAIQLEFNQMREELDQLAQTDFNGVVMLDGKSETADIETAISTSFALDNLSDVDTPLATAVFAVAPRRVGGIACGDFTVYGDASDYSFDNTTGVLTILGGDVVVEGTGMPTTNTIAVAKDVDANITLSNVNINGGQYATDIAFKIADDSTGNVTLTLEGTNLLCGGVGIQKNGDESSGKLTIQGDGVLEAIGNVGAGIGSSQNASVSNIEINSGEIRAFGRGGAGIGSGNISMFNHPTTCSNITINGGNIISLSETAAGLGGGGSSSVKNITINGGNIVAQAGVLATLNGVFPTDIPADGCNGSGAGIGGADNGFGTNASVSDITINGGSVRAYGGGEAAGIGGGFSTPVSNITINDGTVYARSGDGGAAIGSGVDAVLDGITITGGDITAIAAIENYQAQQNGYGGGAGIGSGFNLGYGSANNINISGGEIYAKAYEGGAGIGGGSHASTNDIVISGGMITALGEGGAGIGSGASPTNSSYGTTTADIHINGGNITAVSQKHKTAQGSLHGAGVGGGWSGNATITIENNSTVVIAKGSGASDNIGSGAGGAASDFIIKDELIAEPYNGGGIVNGTIVHYKPNNWFDQYEKIEPIDNLVIQAGSRTKDGVRFTFDYSSKGIGELNSDLNCSSSGLGMEKLSFETQEEANEAIDKIDHAINKVSMVRATFGATQNRLEHKIHNLTSNSENVTAAESGIRDTDMALTMMEYTKENILQSSAQSILAQANQMPQNILSMLGG